MELNLQIRRTSDGYEAWDTSQPQPLGIGNSPDEAIGNAVRNVYLSEDEVTIVDISSDVEHP